MQFLVVAIARKRFDAFVRENNTLNYMKINLQIGTVYWITGLSGAGKTTIGKLLYNHLKNNKSNIVFLDGDELREVFGGNTGHSLEERKKIAMYYSRLSKLLSFQCIDVVCATISMFHECRKWNRKNIKNYKEIYLKVPINILVERDSKKIYSRAMKGEIKDVMGIDINYDEPKDPHLVIENNGDCSSENILLKIINSFDL